MKINKKYNKAYRTDFIDENSLDDYYFFSLSVKLIIIPNRD